MKIGSNQPPSGTVPDSAPSLSMPPDDIQEAIASDIIKVLTPFISLPAQFSSAKQNSYPNHLHLYLLPLKILSQAVVLVLLALSVMWVPKPKYNSRVKRPSLPLSYSIPESLKNL